MQKTLPCGRVDPEVFRVDVEVSSVLDRTVQGVVCGTGKVPDGSLVGRNLLLLDVRQEDSRRTYKRPCFSTPMQEMLQPARRRAKAKIPALGYEFVCFE